MPPRTRTTKPSAAPTGTGTDALAADGAIDLNLDTIEHESNPFTFNFRDRRIVAKDVLEIDVLDLATLRADDPGRFFALCLQPADADFITKEKMKGFEFRELIRVWGLHTGIGTTGNAGA